jgi:hypothetical protein
MSFGLVLVCKIVSPQESAAIAAAADLDRGAPTTLPRGLVSYTSAATASGAVVTEIWATRATKQRLLAEQGAATEYVVTHPRSSDTHRCATRTQSISISDGNTVV